MIEENNAIASGMVWTYVEKVLSQVVAFITAIVLARILDTQDYGIISVVMIFVALCDALVTEGLGTALVQKKDPDELDYNTILICSMILSGVLYIILYISAPAISRFFKLGTITGIIRVIGLRIPLSGVIAIQQAKIQKDFAFQKSCIATLLGCVVSAVVGVVMAVQGFGVWSIVAQYLVSSLVCSVALLVIYRWRIAFEFSILRAKELFAFGWKILLTTIMYSVKNSYRGIVIGKTFGASDLAYYDRGRSLADQIASNILATISKVLFPAMSEIQNDLHSLKELCRKSVRIGLFIISPLLFGLVAISHTFVSAVLTEKWLPCIPFIIICASVFLIRLFGMVIHQAIMAMGRSDTILIIEFVMNTCSVIMIVFSVFVLRSVFYVAVSEIIVEFIGFVLYSFVIRTTVKYRYHEQLYDIFSVLVYGGVMGVTVYAVGLIRVNQIVLLVLQLIVGVVSYLALAYITKSSELIWVIMMVKEKVERFLKKNDY